MNKKNKNKNKMEMSKKILWLSYIIGITLALTVIICSFMNIDCSNITTLAGVAWLEISASNIFYYTMNKRLNAPKIIVGLYNDLPDIDLMIRTSGEIRISNFMLWQLSYAELYFPNCYFPEFNEQEQDKAILEYTKRDRRFGSVIKE